MQLRIRDWKIRGEGEGCMEWARLLATVSDQTVGNILRRHGVAPAPERKHTTSWAAFIRAHLAVLAGTDFFKAIYRAENAEMARPPHPHKFLPLQQSIILAIATAACGDRPVILDAVLLHVGHWFDVFIDPAG
jgi:hypothetical protein